MITVRSHSRKVEDHLKIHMWRLLHEAAMTYQKPEKRYKEVDPVAKAEWIVEQLTLEHMAYPGFRVNMTTNCFEKMPGKIQIDISRLGPMLI